MAEFCIIQKLKASHGKTPEEREFRIEVVVEGAIDPETEYTGGVDFFRVMRDLSMILSPLRGKYLRPILNEAGFRTSVLEAIGVFLFRQLKEKGDYPIKSIRVWENNFISATVFPEDCDFNNRDSNRDTEKSPKKKRKSKKEKSR